MVAYDKSSLDPYSLYTNPSGQAIDSLGNSLKGANGGVYSFAALKNALKGSDTATLSASSTTASSTIVASKADGAGSSSSSIYVLVCFSIVVIGAGVLFLHSQRERSKGDKVV